MIYLFGEKMNSQMENNIIVSEITLVLNPVELLSKGSYFN